jgi:purine nucleosidase
MLQNKDFSASKTSQYVKQSILIDTDIGDDIDDALALALALRSPEIELLGVTTVFGATQRRAQLAAHLLSIAGREDVPIAPGVAQPLQLRHRPSGVPQAAILDERAVFPAISQIAAPEFIIQTAQAHFGRVTLVCIGPLTNVAVALTAEPGLFMALQRIIMMGGSSSIPLPEWNIRSDVRAAQIVLGSGVPITLIGLNVTRRCQLRASDIAQLRNSEEPLPHLLSRLIAVWQRHRPRGQPALPYLHDPLALAALCRPELFTFAEMPVRAITRGPFEGFMVPRMMKGPWVNAAVDIRAEEARSWIMERLLSNPSGAR